MLPCIQSILGYISIVAISVSKIIGKKLILFGMLYILQTFIY